MGQTQDRISGLNDVVGHHKIKNVFNQKALLNEKYSYDPYKKIKEAYPYIKKGK